MARRPLVAPGPELTPDELERYSRQIRLPQIGLEGQRRLKGARVLVLGAGGLGSPVLLYLAGAGVGTIGVVDDDTVDVSNLQRQIIHSAAVVGTSKARSARAAIERLNPLVQVELHEVRLDVGNAAVILAGYDLVIDGTDNFSTRYLANDEAALLGMPYIWGSVLRFDGQMSVFWQDARGDSVTLRDLYPSPPADDELESCSVAGVLGPLCATIGAAMATEALKLIAGFGEPMLGRVLVVDALDGSQTQVPFRAAEPHATAQAQAPAATQASVSALAASSGSGAVSASASSTALAPKSASGSGTRSGTGSPSEPRSASGSDTHRASPAPASNPADATPSITVAQLAERLAARSAGADDFVLVDVREEWEHELVAIDGAVLLPMSTLLSDHARELLMGERVLLHCHHDTRSRYAREVMLQSGYTDVTFVEGGIDAWATTIDPELPRY
ncbi:ThiF family adenylyltransferase [Subtercola sp. PAMC28395]|uniref:ThiF family adenylyltransferase n=1 Tax=Subtercola sp. PAMC28395 TaxID=2846775 RepID=UPI001C0CAEA7|nr:ThiF family adenylyltransferase [Subtercola sp. PAMC28395]QWT22835.1 ThiF family adenylyltransferase [Subtercola sp. PAMC28395]